MKKTTLLLGMLLATAALPAYADDQTDSGVNTERATTDHGMTSHEDTDASTPTGHKGYHHGDHDKMTEMWFKKMDANGDGKVTKAEYDAFNKKRFDEMDTNHDGVLTLDEVKAFDAKKHAEWQQKHADKSASTPSSQQ